MSLRNRNLQRDTERVVVSPITRKSGFKLKEFDVGSTTSPRPLNEHILERGFSKTTARLSVSSKDRVISLVEANKQERR